MPDPGEHHHHDVPDYDDLVRARDEYIRAGVHVHDLKRAYDDAAAAAGKLHDDLRTAVQHYHDCATAYYGTIDHDVAADINDKLPAGEQFHDPRFYDYGRRTY